MVMKSTGGRSQWVELAPLKHNPLFWVFLRAAGVWRLELTFFVPCVCIISSLSTLWMAFRRRHSPLRACLVDFWCVLKRGCICGS